MPNFTPVESTLGGLLIGLSASLSLLVFGRIAGISGIFHGALIRKVDGRVFRAGFLVGLGFGGSVMLWLRPAWFEVPAAQPLWLMGLAGLLVGLGTRLGNGCTSGHGVCGIARLSARSLVATATFMATAAMTVFLMRHTLGG